MRITQALIVSMIPCFSSHALDLSLNYGVGVGNSAKAHSSQVKIVSVSAYENISNHFFKVADLGGYIDSSSQYGGKSSGHISYSLGIKVEPSIFSIRVSHGVGLISHPDNYLGGMFQFFHNFSIGVKDTGVAKIGIKYRHISSASIYKRNLGRDFFMAFLEHRF